MDELLRIFVLGVEWFAIWLERSALQVAWPVLFVALFQAFLSVVHVLQWYARGMFLRIACDYPVTTSKGSSPCKNKTMGEWHRCHKHRHRWLRRTDSHEVDPDLPRWQTIGRGGVRMERADRYGEGMLRARSRSIGLLYYRGYARRPSEVRRLVPELIADYRNRWRELREQLRQWRSGERSKADSVIRHSGVAAAVATTRADVAPSSCPRLAQALGADEPHPYHSCCRTPVVSACFRPSTTSCCLPGSRAYGAGVGSRMR